jgi:hypothetical protein
MMTCCPNTLRLSLGREASWVLSTTSFLAAAGVHVARDPGAVGGFDSCGAPWTATIDGLGASITVRARHGKARESWDGGGWCGGSGKGEELKLLLLTNAGVGMGFALGWAHETGYLSSPRCGTGWPGKIFLDAGSMQYLALFPLQTCKVGVIMQMWVRCGIF